MNEKKINEILYDIEKTLITHQKYLILVQKIIGHFKKNKNLSDIEWVNYVDESKVFE